MPKVKIFVWKTANDIIGAEANLHTHHIPIQPRCVLCDFHWANTSHVLFYCQGIKKVWKDSGWWGTLKPLKDREIKEILLHIEETSNISDWNSFCMKMWGVWKDRCTFTHSNNKPHATLEKPGHWTDIMLSSYVKANDIRKNINVSLVTKYRFGDHTCEEDTYSLFTDAATKRSTDMRWASM